MIRTATEDDAPAIAAIYNEAVATTVATMDTEPRSLDEQLRWLKDHPPPYVVLVAESGDAVIGWASISRWSERRAYDGTAEVSEYVDAARRGHGVGRALLDRLIEAGDRSGFHSLLARIADGNAASLHLHESRGFRTAGVMREVGWKFGRRIDVHLLQRLNPGGPPEPRPAGAVRASPAVQS
jgi:L-amino acid N-acyltransferase